MKVTWSNDRFGDIHSAYDAEFDFLIVSCDTDAIGMGLRAWCWQSIFGVAHPSIPLFV
jgi:hypothetical protein